MIGWLLVTAFVAEPAPASGGRAVEPPAQRLKIDILVKQPEQKCEAQSADEIVVCAEKMDNESQRLRPILNEAAYSKDESKAEFSIAENAVMAVENEAAALPQGAQSNRLMVRLKLKF